ncbi:MAG: hypothetical protein QXX95_03290 [Nitrososphaerales archaeon]
MTEEIGLALLRDAAEGDELKGGIGTKATIKLLKNLDLGIDKAVTLKPPLQGELTLTVESAG